MRPYLVTDPNGQMQLVRAKTKQGAINHLVNKKYSAKAASGDEVLAYINKGGTTQEVSTTNVDQKTMPFDEKPEDLVNAGDRPSGVLTDG